MTEAVLPAHRSRADVLRLASAGAFATLGLFLLCWATIAIGVPFGATHAFVSLFTMQPIASIQALCMGALWAFIAGGVAATFVAHCYNLAGRVLGR